MFRQGFFTSDSWTINGDGFAIGNKAEGSDFFAKIVHKCLGDGAAEVTTTGFQVVKKTGLTCTVKPFFVCKNGYIAWNAEDTDITFTSSESEQVFYVGVRLDVATGEFTGDNAAEYATFVSATDVAAAKITITANAVTLTDGMIEDLRYDTAYCGQIDEYRERSLALIAELEDALALLISGSVPAHASTHATGAADAVTPAAIGAASLTGVKITASEATASINNQTANYTAQQSDVGKLILMNVSTPNTITIPPQSIAFVGLDEFEICQYGAGQTTIVAGQDVVLYSLNGALKTAGRYACVTLKKMSNSSNNWLVSGALTL